MKQRHQITPASYLYLEKDNQVVLLRRFNTGYEDGNYSMIAGHVDEGETFTDCIIREAKEEAGITIKKEDLEVVHLMLKKNLRIDLPDINIEEYLDVYIKASNWIDDIKIQEKNKCDDMSWFDIDKLPENTIPYVKFAIENIRNRVTYSEFGW